MIALSLNIAGVFNGIPPLTDKTIPFLHALIQFDPITELLTVHTTQVTKRILKGLNDLTTSQHLSSTGPISPHTFQQDIKKLF